MTFQPMKGKTMRYRTVYGIGLNTGDMLAHNTYIYSMERYDGHRFANLKKVGQLGLKRIRLDDNQLYKVDEIFHAPFKRYIIGKVVNVETTGYTVYGNPICHVLMELIDGRVMGYRMSDNAMLAYAIRNPEYKETLHYFELTKADRLSGRDRDY